MTKHDDRLPTTPSELRRLARERTEALLEQATRYFGVSMPVPSVQFDLRGKTAGQVRTNNGRDYRIRYNAALLTRHGQDFLARTVPHETAHIVTFRLHGPRVQPHGSEWQAIMRLFGTAPERCHDFNVDGLQTRHLQRFHYRCACRSHQLTSIRHNRILRGQSYLCRHCGQNLKRVSATENTDESG